jgi:hypothetical protein
MNTITYYVIPEWISIAFLIAIPLPFIVIIYFFRKETFKTPHAWLVTFVTAFFSVYLVYIGFASFLEWFNPVSFPPRVLLFTTLPYAFFLFGYVLNTNLYQKIVTNAPLENLVKLHVFRLLGVFFILLALHDALPKPFAYIAGVGDVLTAISSIFVAKAIQQRKRYTSKLTLYWNIFGTIDILFTAIAANVLTKISIDTGAMGVDTLARFPFCIIPAFAPPTILLIHWAIFKKLKKQSS